MAYYIIETCIGCTACTNRCPTDAIGAVITFAALMYTHDWALYLTAATGLALLWLAWRDGDRVRLVWVNHRAAFR